MLTVRGQTYSILKEKKRKKEEEEEEEKKEKKKPENLTGSKIQAAPKS